MSKLGAVYIGNTPPATPGDNILWLSTAPEDLICPPPSHRRPVIGNGFAGETGAIQEPSVWYYGGKWHMTYGSGNGVKYAYADHPLGSWTPSANYVYGGGYGGFSGIPGHHSIYIEGDYLYMLYADSTTTGSTATSAFGMARAALSDPTTWTKLSWSFIPGSSYNTAGMGNTMLLKDDDGSYVLFWEVSYGGYSWQQGWAKSSSLTGTYTIQSFPTPSLSPMIEHYPDLKGLVYSSMGNPWLMKSNGLYVMYYGCTAPVSGTTQIYRATSRDLASWSISNNSLPIIKTGTRYEVDQAVDPALCQGPDGQWYAFWSGLDNQTGVGQIMCSPMMPALKMFDGQGWVATNLGQDQFVEQWNHSASSGAATAKNLDLLVVDTNSASSIITLPRAASGARVRIVNYNSSTSSSNTLTVACNAADKIVSSATVAIGQDVVFECLVPLYWFRRG